MTRKLFSLIFLLLTGFIGTKGQTLSWKLMHQGNRAFSSGHYDEAEKNYLKALTLYPNNARAAFNLGDTYLAKNNPQEALKQYDAAIRTEQNKTVKAMAYHNRGYIYQTMAGQNQEKRGEFLKQAIEEYKEALRNNPTDNDTRYNLALCQKQLKDNQNQPRKQPQQQSQSQQQPQPPQQQKSDPQQADPRTEQLLNLSRQAERRAREKVNNARPRHKTLDKNW